MKVSKTSWHYKMNEFVYYNSPKKIRPDEKTNLCSYFWFTVFNIPQLILALIKYVLFYDIPKTPRFLWPKKALKGANSYDTGVLFLNLFPFLFLCLGTIVGYFCIGSIIFALLIDLPTALYFSREYGFDIFLYSLSPVSQAIFMLFGILLIASILTSMIFGIYFLFLLFYRKRIHRDNILIAYIKAWKDKNCPLIEFTDE